MLYDIWYDKNILSVTGETKLSDSSKSSVKAVLTGNLGTNVVGYYPSSYR